MIVDASVASAERYLLGEGAYWDAERQVLRWIDIDAGSVLEGRLAGGRVTDAAVVHRSSGTVGATAAIEGGGLLIAEERSLAVLTREAEVASVFPVIPDSVSSRLNDGAVDPAGRFLVGTLATDGRRGQERLLRLERDGSFTVVDSDLTISNGLGWSPDGGTLYSVDSVPGNIWQRDYDGHTGRIGRRRLLTRIEDGEPDGLTVDAEGTIWVAIWGAGEILALNPRGEVVHTVRATAPLTTSCAFGGPDLATLVVTSARKPVAGVRSTSDSGALFTAEVGAIGLPATPWAAVDPAIREEA